MSFCTIPQFHFVVPNLLAWMLNITLPRAHGNNYRNARMLNVLSFQVNNPSHNGINRLVELSIDHM